MTDKLLDHISMDPHVMAGKPVIRGTRIPVELVVRMVAQGVTESEILKQYPRLKHDDVRAALEYAADVIAHEDVFPIPATA